MRTCKFYSDNFNNYIWPFYMQNANYSYKTKVNVRTGLFKLASYLHKCPLDITSKEAKKFAEYLQSLTTSGSSSYLNPNYVRILFFSIRDFYKFIFTNKIYLKTAYQLDISCDPFSEIFINNQFRNEYTVYDIPTYDDLDKLLSHCINNSVKIAIYLSYRLGLTCPELVSTTRRNFIKNNNKYYLEIIDKKKKSRLLSVPDDLFIEIDSLVKSYQDTDDNHLLLNPGKTKFTHYTTRTLNRQLETSCENAGIKVTFQDLRNMFIFEAKASDIPNKEIADFLGIQGSWITRYNITNYDKVKRVSEYINFIMK